VTPAAIHGHTGRFLGRDESGRGGEALGACGFVRGGVKQRDSTAAMGVGAARVGKTEGKRELAGEGKEGRQGE
jgi:hypothetical protein